MARLPPKSFPWKSVVTKTLTAKMLSAPEKRFDLSSLQIDVPETLKKRGFEAKMRIRDGPTFSGVFVKLQTSGATLRWFATFPKGPTYALFCAQLEAGTQVAFTSIKEGRDVVIEVAVVAEGAPAPAVTAPAPVAAPRARAPARRRPANADEAEEEASLPVHRHTHRGTRTRGAGTAAAPRPPTTGKRQRDDDDDDFEPDLEDNYVDRMKSQMYLKRARYNPADERQVWMAVMSDVAAEEYIRYANKGAFKINMELFIRAAPMLEAEEMRIRAEADAAAAAEAAAAEAAAAEAAAAEAAAAAQLAGAADLFLEAAMMVENQAPEASPTPTPAAAPTASPPAPRSAARRGQAKKGGAVAVKITSAKKIAKEAKKEKKKAPKPAAYNLRRRSLRDGHCSDEEIEADYDVDELAHMDDEEMEEYMEEEKAIYERAQGPKRLSDQDAPDPIDATAAMLDLLEEAGPSATPGFTATLHKTASLLGKEGGMKKKATRGTRGGATKQAKKARDASVEDMDMD